MYEYNTNLQTYKYKYIWDSQWQSCLMFHMLSLFWLKMTLYNQESQSVLPSNSCQLELPFFCISPWPSPQKCLMTRIQQAPTRSGCAEEGLCAGWGWCTRQPCVLQRPRKKHCQFPTQWKNKLQQTWALINRMFMDVSKCFNKRIATTKWLSNENQYKMLTPDMNSTWELQKNSAYAHPIGPDNYIYIHISHIYIWGYMYINNKYVHIHTYTYIYDN